MALIYIDRLIVKNQNFIANSHCIHRIILMSVMIAAKYYDDFYYNNENWAFVGGIPLTEINKLEIEYLFLLHFDLSIDPDKVRIYYYIILYYIYINIFIYISISHITSNMKHTKYIKSVIIYDNNN